MGFPAKSYKRDGEGGEVEGNTVQQRAILNCVGRVPRGYEWLHIFLDNHYGSDNKESVDS